jgi:hypothetical protein
MDWPSWIQAVAAAVAAGAAVWGTFLAWRRRNDRHP